LLCAWLNTDLLSLGISSEELFRAVKSYVRQLAAIVHPDTQSRTVDSRRAQEIQAAFETLQKYDDFASALSRLVEDRSRGSRETKQLHELIERQGKRIVELERELIDNKLRRQDLQTESGLVAQKKAELRKLEAEVKVSEGILKRKVPFLRKQSQQLDSIRRQRGELVRAIYTFFFGLPPIDYTGEIKAGKTLHILNGRRKWVLRGETLLSTALIGSCSKQAHGTEEIFRSGFSPTIAVGRWVVLRGRKSCRVDGQIESITAAGNSEEVKK